MNYAIDPFQNAWPMHQNMAEPFFYDNDANFYPYIYTDMPAVPQIEQGLEAAVRGQEPVVQTFYEGPEKCDCCINWIEKQPVQMPESEIERYDRAAICVYRCKNHEKEASRVGGLISLRHNRVVIQSRLLCDLIGPTLKAEGATVPEKGHLEFLYPFKELYFSYGKLMKLSEGHHEHSDQLTLLKLLEEIMKSLFVDLSAKVNQFRSKGTINYECLWTLFPKGMIVYRKLYGTEMLLRVTKIEPRRIPYNPKAENSGKERKVEVGFDIHCESIGFDGSNFGAITEGFYVIKFEEEKKITSLAIYPLGFHPEKGLRAKCTDRGRKILDLQSVVHCGYEGSAKRALDYGEYAFVTGRVIIDPFRFIRLHPDWAEAAEPLDDDQGLEVHFHNDFDSPTVAERPISEPRAKLSRIDFDSDTRPSPEQQHQNRSFLEVRPHLLMLMAPTIQGFSLKLNQWFDLHLSKLCEITWMTNPLDSLVFDTNVKRMLASFSKHHTSVPEPAAGPLAAKGQGLVILLSGPSGTGKTLTAEVMAEETKRPLYRVMAGQLGSEPRSIESELEEVLDLASEWRTVVLVDEADTFIRSRKSSDRLTSEIVSIFLRRLEYFPGLIFLTTNMPHDIDAAFRSRCRLHIPYRNLTATSRQLIWKLNFSKAGFKNSAQSSEVLDFDQPHGRGQKVPEGEGIRLVLNDEELQQLVSWRLSGREIQNVVQNVALWCKTDAVAVTKERLNTAIHMTVPYAKKRADNSDSENNESEDNESNAEKERPRKRPRMIVGR